MAARETRVPVDEGWTGFAASEVRRARLWRVVALLDHLAEQRGALYPWVPVWFSLGIGAWFTWPSEPDPRIYAVAALSLAAAPAFRWRGGERARVPAAAILLLMGGFLIAGYRSHSVAGPVLAYRYYGPVEGRVIDIDRSYSDALRLTLDQVVLKDIPPDATPVHVRVALHDPGAATDAASGSVPNAAGEPQPGMRIRIVASLARPDGPVAPYGFDFQRLAWFSRLGAVGYSRAPFTIVAPPENSPALWAFMMRMRLSSAIRGAIEGQAGALSSAFMTGDRSGVDSDTNDAMRASNLSHMISISGLHMGLLVGFVFALIRYGVALVPYLALRLPAKKIAAVIALLAATFYMVLAGADVATRRSYIMAAVMLVAILAERRAVSLRTLAAAAMIVLILEPESLTEPGFQMSFGATLALILSVKPWESVKGHVPALLRPVVLIVWTSLVASLATGPIAAAHFNRIAGYGLVANLLANPPMAVMVMPMGVIAMILAPFGLAWLPLWIMGLGTRIILAIAHFVASLDGSVRSVVSPDWTVLPCMAAGTVLVVLSRGRLRWAGAAAVILAVVMWARTERPDLLIAGDGQAVGMMTETGRAVSKPKGAGFIVDAWLQDDGDLSAQQAAWLRSAFASPRRGQYEATWNGRLLIHLTGKTAAARAEQLCQPGRVLVVGGYWHRRWADTPCEMWDMNRLSATGSVAIYREGDGYRVVTARQAAGERDWNRRPPRRPKKPNAPAADARSADRDASGDDGTSAHQPDDAPERPGRAW